MLSNPTDSHRETLEKALENDSVLLAEDRTRRFFVDIVNLFETHGNESLWIFGASVDATVLDAHIVPFIARLMDCERYDLIPDKLQKYASRVMALPEWRDVTHGRSTLWNVSIGHVHLLDEI